MQERCAVRTSKNGLKPCVQMNKRLQSAHFWCNSLLSGIKAHAYVVGFYENCSLPRFSMGCAHESGNFIASVVLEVYKDPAACAAGSLCEELHASGTVSENVTVKASVNTESFTRFRDSESVNSAVLITGMVSSVRRVRTSRGISSP